jgi:hypothetical protein
MSSAAWSKVTVLGKGAQVEPLMLTYWVLPNRIDRYPGVSASDAVGEMITEAAATIENARPVRAAARSVLIRRRDADSKRDPFGERDLV